MRNVFIPSAVAVLLVLLTAGSVWSQAVEREFKGTVVRVRTDGLEFRAANGDVFTATTQRSAAGFTFPGIGPPEVKVTGTARPSFLRREMVVEFEGLFRGRSLSEPVKALKIVSRTPATKPGLYPVDNPGEELPDGIKKNRVVGIIRSDPSDLTFRVNYGRTLTVQVDPKAIITLNAQNLLFGGPGDEVKVSGFQAAPSAIVTTRINIVHNSDSGGVRAFDAVVETARPGATAGSAKPVRPRSRFRGRILKIN